MGQNPPCPNCGFDGLFSSDEISCLCPDCGERPFKPDAYWRHL